jgi:hypothetical protein
LVLRAPRYDWTETLSAVANAAINFELDGRRRVAVVDGWLSLHKRKLVMSITLLPIPTM